MRSAGERHDDEARRESCRVTATGLFGALEGVDEGAGTVAHRSGSARVVVVMAGIVPGVAVAADLPARWLAKDLVAGLVLTALLVPQGMAYAELAGLPPITGLYTSILCLLGYAVFGPSRMLVLGPDSALGPMIAATILPLVGATATRPGPSRCASMLALLVGAIMIAGRRCQARASSPTCCPSRPRSAT